MNGWGYHWTPCRSGGALAGLGGVVAAVVAAAWVFANLAWILAVVAACAVLAPVLAIVVVPRLVSRRDRKDAVAYEAQRPAPLPAQDVPAAFPAAGARPAIGPVYNFNFYGVPDHERAAIIRAIPGTAGDAITEGK